MFRPCVECDVAFRDDDHATQSVRAEFVKHIGHVSSASADDRIDESFSDSLRVGESCEIAVVEIDEGVPGECHEMDQARIARAAWWPQ